MPRRTRRSHRRRSFRARPERRRRGMTATKALQGFLMLAPAVAKGVSDADANGGLMSKQGITKGLVPSISTSYTGYNTNDGKFYPEDMLVGWAPVAIVGIASKLGLFRRISRVIG